MILALFIATGAMAGPPVRDAHVEAQLVAHRAGIVPGEPFEVGLRLQHDPHWHTYWKTTATGYASDLEWDLPEGFAAGEIQWPVPRVYEFGGFTEYVYEGEVLLPVTISPPADLEIGSTVTLRATASWLMCAKVCIPGEVELSLTLPVVASEAPKNPRWSAAFGKAEAHQPVALEDYSLAAWRADADTAVLEIKGDPAALAGELYFFDEQTFIYPEAEQAKTMPAPDTARLTFPIDPAGVGEVERFRGVLRTSTSWVNGADRPGLIVDIPFQKQPPEAANGSPTSANPTTASAGTGKPAGFLAVLAGAFLGGLILNLMPCVFPVLGIKIMGFVNQAGEARAKIVAHGLVFTLGVLLSFWVLAGALIFLRAGGDQLGWGFQLQNPAFVYLLATFLLLFALNMSGVFEWGNSAVGVGGRLAGRQGLSGSFLSGILATIVATPCAAPFLGPALGAALALPPISSIAVFTAIALGLALPYLLLSAFPRLVKLLPRPGPWMESLKQFLAFLLYGTVGFLFWVLVGQLTEDGGFTSLALLWSIFGLLAAALAAWIYGRWASPERQPPTRRRAMAIAMVVLVTGLAVGYPRPVFDPDQLSAEAPAVEWEEWAPDKAEELAAEGRAVYVDFTARWCVTCQSNKLAVFSSERVRRFFQENDVVALKADWTNQDPTIAAELARFGRSAVPFNLVYGPGLDSPRPLPEILTPGIVLEALHAATDISRLPSRRLKAELQTSDAAGS